MPTKWCLHKTLKGQGSESSQPAERVQRPGEWCVQSRHSSSPVPRCFLDGCPTHAFLCVLYHRSPFYSRERYSESVSLRCMRPCLQANWTHREQRELRLVVRQHNLACPGARISLVESSLATCSYLWANRVGCELRIPPGSQLVNLVSGLREITFLLSF